MRANRRYKRLNKHLKILREIMYRRNLDYLYSLSDFGDDMSRSAEFRERLMGRGMHGGCC